MVWKRPMTGRIGTSWTLLWQEGIPSKTEEVGIWMYIYSTFFDFNQRNPQSILCCNQRSKTEGSFSPFLFTSVGDSFCQVINKGVSRGLIRGLLVHGD